MIVHAAESLYWFNTTEPPYLIKRLPISLESRHTTMSSGIGGIKWVTFATKKCQFYGIHNTNF